MLSGWCGANRFEHGEVTRHDPVDVRAYSNQRSDARFRLNRDDSLRHARRCQAWLQSGQAGSRHNAKEFLNNTIHRLGETRVALLRAGSGFCDVDFLEDLEERKMHYIIALRQTQPLQRALINNTQGWWPLGDDKGALIPRIELTRFQYQANNWDKPRWVVGVRQHIEQRVEQKPEAQSIWRLYRGRADCENRIKELKYDFAADSFSMKDFWATEAALNTVMLAYNLMSLLNRVLLKTIPNKRSSHKVQQTLQTLRY
jgi:hypothetical protein